MKKLLFIFVLIVPIFCFSQTYFGFKSGYSLISKVNFLPDIKPTGLIGQSLDMGLVIKNFDNKWVGFQGEIYKTQRGYNAPFKETNSFRRINNYIELPIFFQLQIDLRWIYLHANAGCFAAYLLSAKEGVDTSGTMVMNSVQFNILKDNRFDYGLIGGAGISHEFRWGVIQIEARVLYGYADLYNYKYTGMPEQSKAVAQNISFSYLYNFSKDSKKKKTAGKQ